MLFADASRAFTESILAGEPLGPSLEDVAAALGAPGATLVVGDTAERSVVYTPSITDICEDYFRDWRVLDPREAKVQPSLAEGFTSDLRDFSVREIAHEPFYQEFLVPRGFCWHATAALAVLPAPWVLSLKRHVGVGMYGVEELDQLDRALPELRRAVALASSQWRAALRGDLALLAHLGRGAWVVDRNNHPLERNALANDGDGLAVRNGRLTAELRGQQPTFNDALAHARLGADGIPAPTRVLLHRQRDTRFLLVECISVAHFRHDLPSSAAVLVVTSDPHTNPRTSAEQLRSTFGFTPREAELAALLASGYPLGECATRLGISLSNARSRTRAVYRKANVHGQVELASLLAQF